MAENKILICIGGPTASGKTALAIKLAEKYDGWFGLNFEDGYVYFHNEDDEECGNDFCLEIEELYQAVKLLRKMNPKKR